VFSPVGIGPRKAVWSVGRWERVVVDEVWGGWLTNNTWGDDDMGGGGQMPWVRPHSPERTGTHKGSALGQSTKPLKIEDGGGTRSRRDGLQVIVRQSICHVRLPLLLYAMTS
jgi:hypothetical protein